MITCADLPLVWRCGSTVTVTLRTPSRRQALRGMRALVPNTVHLILPSRRVDGGGPHVRLTDPTLSEIRERVDAGDGAGSPR